MFRNYLKAGLGAAALTAALTVTVTAQQAAQAADGPAITVAVNKLARGLDPVEQTGTVDTRVYYSIYDTLIRRDFASETKGGAAKLIPGLATSWTRTAPNRLELELRQGVSCHDGNPFNADDVLSTFDAERLWGPKSYYARGREYFSHLTSVEKLGDYKVAFTTEGPDAALELLLSSYTSFIVCDEAWNAHKEAGVDYTVWMDKASKAMNWNPVGTGPYKFASYQKNDHIKLDAFDAYWGGKPAAASINFKAVPEVAARISGLVSGEFDIVVDLTPDQWDVIDRYDDIKQESVVLDNTHVLVFNTSDPVMGSKKLRQGLSLAIDRSALINALWRGKTYTPKGHQLEKFGAMYVKDRPGYVTDVEKAKKLIAESGYKGEKISYRLIPNYYPYNVEAAQIIQEMWRTVGVNVELDFVESFKAVRAKGSQIYAWSNTYRIPDPAGAMLPLYGPNAAIQKKYKFFGAPAEYNKLADELLQTADMTERQAKFARMLDIFEDEMPITMLYNPLTTYAMKKNIEWTPYTLFYMDFRPDNFTVN